MKKDMLLINKLWKEYVFEQFKYGPDRLTYMMTFSEHTKFFFTHLNIVNFHINTANDKSEAFSSNYTDELFNFHIEYLRFQNYHLQGNEIKKEAKANFTPPGSFHLPKEITQSEEPHLFKLFSGFVTSLIENNLLENKQWT